MTTIETHPQPAKADEKALQRQFVDFIRTVATAAGGVTAAYGAWQLSRLWRRRARVSARAHACPHGLYGRD